MPKSDIAVMNPLNEMLVDVTKKIEKVTEAVVDKYNNIVNKEIDNFVEGINVFADKAIDKGIDMFSKAVGDKVKALPIGQEAQDVLNKATTGLCSTILGFAKDVVKDIGKATVDIGKEVGKEIAGFGKKLLGSVCSFFKGEKTKDEVIKETKTAFKEGKDHIVEKVGAIMSKTGASISGHADKAYGKAAGHVDDAKKGVKETFGKHTEKLVEKAMNSIGGGKERH